MPSQALVPLGSSGRKNNTQHTSDSSPTDSSTPTSPSDREILDVTDTLLDEIDDVLETEVKSSEILTLGDLIRNGSQLNPQAIGAYRGPAGETCALSAAYEAAQILGLV